MRKLIITFMLLVSVLFVSCSSSECREDDFEFNIFVRKSEVSVGNSIKITVILKNISGKTLKIKMYRLINMR